MVGQTWWAAFSLSLLFLSPGTHTWASWAQGREVSFGLRYDVMALATCPQQRGERAGTQERGLTCTWLRLTEHLHRSGSTPGVTEHLPRVRVTPGLVAPSLPPPSQSSWGFSSVSVCLLLSPLEGHLPSDLGPGPSHLKILNINHICKDTFPNKVTFKVPGIRPWT